MHDPQLRRALESEHRRWRHRTLTMLGVLAAGALVLAACGDGSDPIDAATDAASDSGVDTEAVTDTVNDAADAAEETAGDVADDVEEAADDMADDASDGVDTGEISEQSAELAAILRDNDMATLASAVEQVDVAELIGSETFTLFGPNDEAFLGLTADETADLLADPEQLADVLRNHVVAERIDAAQLAGMASVTTLTDGTLAVADEDGTITVGGAQVVTPDIDAGGGVIHVIDQVILP